MYYVLMFLACGIMCGCESVRKVVDNSTIEYKNVKVDHGTVTVKTDTGAISCSTGGCDVVVKDDTCSDGSCGVKPIEPCTDGSCGVK